MKISFLGMGLMGTPMASQCISAGHDLTVYNRTAEKCRSLGEAGASVAPTPAEAAKGKDAVLICVEDTPDVEEVIFGAEGIVEGLSKLKEPPPLIIDHSTISAVSTEAFAQRLAHDHGILYLDAPVSGGDVGARAGTLSIMCGGPREAFDRAHPLLEAMGKTIVHVGPRNGDGQRAKMINQFIVAINVISTTEAMRLGEAMGMDMEKVLEAISGGAAASWSLSNLGPLWLERQFQPGFRLRHLLKDVKFSAEAFDSLPEDQSHPFPGIKLAQELIQRSVDEGNGDLHIHALAKIFLAKNETKAS